MAQALPIIFAGMQDEIPSVGIVILNYNGRNLLEKFLPSVFTSVYPKLKIYVADNGSTDDSLAYVSQHFSEVNTIDLSYNQGFAGGYNNALSQVDADYFILLNSDVEVGGNWIYPVIDLMETNPKIAICQPKLLSYQQKDYFEYAGAAGGWVDRLGYAFAKGRVFETVEKDLGQYNQSEPIFWASGAALFIKKAVWQELGGFDDYLFAHQEEIDLCWRAQLLGYQVYYCAESKVYHLGGGTLNKSNPRKTYLNFRNSLIILYKNLPRQEAIFKILSRLLLDGVFGFKLLFGFHWKEIIAIIKAHFGFYKWLFSSKRIVFPPTKSLKSLQGTVNQSIVWLYFIKKKKTFYEIVGKK